MGREQEMDNRENISTPFLGHLPPLQRNKSTKLTSHMCTNRLQHLLRQRQQRPLPNPRSKHLNPLPPNPLLPARSLSPQPRPNSPHPAQRPGPLRDNPRRRSRSSLPSGWLRPHYLILNRRERQRERLLDRRESASRDFRGWSGCDGG